MGDVIGWVIVLGLAAWGLAGLARWLTDTPRSPDPDGWEPHGMPPDDDGGR